MQTKAATATLATVLSLISAFAHAQELPLEYETAASTKIHKHDGFYLNLSLGGGYSYTRAGFSPEPPNSENSNFRGGGIATQLLIGGTPARGWVIGGGTMSMVVPSAALQADGKEVADGSMLLGSTGVFSTYYFDPKKGLHALAYLGVASLDYGEGFNSDGDLALGFSGALGLGHDWWVGEQWSIGLVGRVQYARTWLKVTGFPGLKDTKIHYDSFAPALLASFTYH